MMTLQLPDINGKTTQQQVGQITTYLYQLARYLQVVQDTVKNDGVKTLQTNISAATTGGGQITQEAWIATKSLIIKSADIVEAFYNKIDTLLKLSGYYMAQSDFGTFKEETLNQISATNALIRQNITDLQSIYDENGNIKAELLVNGHIYSGIIEYAKDGEAIVGIELGQTTTVNGTETFNKFARFTADRLEFYNALNPNEPVAYISDYKLYITHVEITGSLIEGGYKDFVSADGSVITKWVGGS